MQQAHGMTMDMAAAIWTLAGGDPSRLAQLHLSNTDSQLPSAFPVGALASATIATQALMAAELWRLRGGATQTVSVDQLHAQASFRSERYLLVGGKPPPDPWSPLSGYYQAGDGRWIQLHTNFAHHRDGVLRVLQCADRRDAVGAAIATWKADELDRVMAAEGLCAAMVRTPDEWRTHPQAIALAGMPLFALERIGDTPPQPLPRACPGGRPLDGVRVLDLSRVIAAPVAGRTLAQHGADVLAISAAHLPNIAALVIDTGRGKRAAQLDLRTAAGCAQLRALVRGADIFLHAYRPGTLAARGFSSAALQALRPGLIEISLCAYGDQGPWAQRRGFDSLVQSATGIAWQEGQAADTAIGASTDQPGKLPCQALDHGSGYLAALCAMAALQRRTIHGGGWRAKLSLAQTGAWLQRWPLEHGAVRQQELDPAQVAGWRDSVATSFGQVQAVTPADFMSATPPRYALPPSALDAHRASWEAQA